MWNCKNTFLVVAVRSLVLALGLVLSGGTAMCADNQLIAGGDMGSLDVWDPPRLPSSAGREIVEENSPFNEVYPSNGKCVKLTDSPNLVHQRYLSQQISPGTGKLVWSFDYKRLANDEGLPDGGFFVRLTSGDKPVVWVGIGDSVAVNISKGKPGVSLSQIKPNLLQRGIWYHFRAELDLATQRISGTLSSEIGDAFELPEVELVPDEAADSAMVDGMALGANNGSGPEFSKPILFDNFSLQQLP